MRSLPPLNWLKSFEGAARHLSITRAAEELSVTQAAVSQQVKSLEEYLGLALFRRTRQRLFLTEPGQALAPKLREAFDLMDAGVRECLAQDAEGTLTLRVGSSFAPQWLMPRLGRFHARYPDIDIRLTTVDKETDFARDDVDLEIRYGHGPWPDLACTLLMHDQVFPVCAPGLLEGDEPLNEPSDLARHRLLHVTGYREDWQAWCASAAVRWVPTKRGHTFDHSVLAIQAAINGAGFALGRASLVQAELDAGRLVAPFDAVLDTAEGYWLIYPSSRADQPSIAALRTWLLEEVGAARNTAPTS
jgi:LysR family transcriptional regulator, glycine cleavage system transcriptional activator